MSLFRLGLLLLEMSIPNARNEGNQKFLGALKSLRVERQELGWVDLSLSGQTTPHSLASLLPGPDTDTQYFSHTILTSVGEGEKK